MIMFSYRLISMATSRTKVVVVVVNLASRPPHFLGSASSAPERQGRQYGANLSKRFQLDCSSEMVTHKINLSRD